MNNEIVIKTIDYRPCFVNERKALFHKWIESNNLADIFQRSTLGLIEYEDGQVDEVVLAKIKFCDNLIEEYAFKESGKENVRR